MFLKYYHIEQLQHKFEEQHRRVILAQSVLRMWLARRRYRKKIAAIDTLFSHIQTNETGPPALGRSIQIEGSWVDGRTLRKMQS